MATIVFPSLLLLGDRAGLVYADTLMSVYEEIARKLDVYLVVIESCYGKNG